MKYIVALLKQPPLKYIVNKKNSLSHTTNTYNHEEKQELLHNDDNFHKDILRDKGSFLSAIRSEPNSPQSLFWTFFFFGVIVSVVCLTAKKREDVETSEDVEQPRSEEHTTGGSASQHLPLYYLHTLHRSQCLPPTTVIQNEGSDTNGHAETDYSSTESNNVCISVKFHKSLSNFLEILGNLFTSMMHNFKKIHTISDQPSSS